MECLDEASAGKFPKAKMKARTKEKTMNWRKEAVKRHRHAMGGAKSAPFLMDPGPKVCSIRCPLFSGTFMADAGGDVKSSFRVPREYQFDRPGRAEGFAGCATQAKRFQRNLQTRLRWQARHIKSFSQNLTEKLTVRVELLSKVREDYEARQKLPDKCRKAQNSNLV
jgi:hypothetical protein